MLTDDDATGVQRFHGRILSVEGMEGYGHHHCQQGESSIGDQFGERSCVATVPVTCIL